MDKEMTDENVSIELVDFGDFVLAPLAYAAFTEFIPQLELEGRVDVKVSGLYVDERPPLRWIRNSFCSLLKYHKGLQEHFGLPVDDFISTVSSKEFQTQFMISRRFRDEFYEQIFNPFYQGIMDIFSQVRDGYLEEKGLPAFEQTPIQFPSNPNADYHIAVDNAVIPYANGRGIRRKLKEFGRALGYGNPEVQTMQQASGCDSYIVTNPLGNLDQVLAPIAQLGKPDFGGRVAKRLGELGLCQRGKYDFFENQYENMRIQGFNLLKKFSDVDPWDLTIRKAREAKGRNEKYVGVGK
ncbi:MAG: hypothetical protein V1740_06160 [Candidatus Woesearchaeota archaeon]